MRFLRNLYIIVYILSFKFIIDKRASLACAAHLADTLCPPNALFVALAHIVNYSGITPLNMSVLLLKKKSLEKSSNT